MSMGDTQVTIGLIETVDIVLRLVIKHGIQFPPLDWESLPEYWSD